MSPDKQRMTIAESLGWTECNLATQYPYIPSGLNGNQERCWLPDYLNDLNAMKDAEHWLEFKCLKWQGALGSSSAPEAYMNHLQNIVGNDDWLFMGASAAQRAEAFLRTIGKWRDDETD